MFAGSKMYKACELAENIKVEILIVRFIRRLKKLVGIEIVKILSSIDCIISMLDE